MQKIASPQHLATQLQTLIQMASGPERPSRIRLAAELQALADVVEGRIATGPKVARGGYDPFTVEKIRKLTDQNHHSEALAAGARMLGYDVLAKKFGLIAELHSMEGGLPRNLMAYQDGLYDQLMKMAERELAPDEWADFYGAF